LVSHHTRVKIPMMNFDVLPLFVFVLI
jgi:hypothetical protein